VSSVATEGSVRAVVTAMFANLGIAVTKFVAFLLTASSSMLAESVHLLADTSNQALLLLGGNRASARRHPSIRSATVVSATFTPSSGRSCFGRWWCQSHHVTSGNWTQPMLGCVTSAERLRSWPTAPADTAIAHVLALGSRGSRWRR